MTSIVHFTALTGSLSDRPLCYLLRLDDALFLLDCGWDDRFLPEDLDLLASYARQVNVLLLSHPDLPHLGAYPYAYAHLGLECTVYATLPTVNMGRMCLQDAVLRRADEEDFSLMTPASINAAFDRIHPLRYSQPTSLLGQCLGISITAYAAGHSIGGTIWKIQKESDEIVYAVDINHRRELHLNGTTLHANGSILDALHRPSLLITSANSSLSSTAPRKDRYSSLHTTLLDTLAAGGNVLLPIDASARVLELLYLLEQHWALHRISYPILFLSKSAYRTIHYAKSMLEWMGDGITEQFAATRENPFDLKHIRLCHRVEEVDAIQGPKVVLATGTSLLSGPSRVLLSQWAPYPEHVLLLTQKSFPSSLAHELLQLWEAASGVSIQEGLGPKISLPSGPSHIPIKKCVALEGKELEEYWMEEAKKRLRLEEEEALRREAAILSGEAVTLPGAEESDEEGEEEEGEGGGGRDREGEGHGIKSSRSRLASLEINDSMLPPSRKRERIKEAESTPNDPANHVLYQQFDVYVRDLYQGGLDPEDLEDPVDEGFEGEGEEGDPRAGGGRKRVFLGDALLRMFPFQERRRRFNEYGEAIHAEDYMKVSDLQAASSLPKAFFGSSSSTPSSPSSSSVTPMTSSPDFSQDPLDSLLPGAEGTSEEDAWMSSVSSSSSSSSSLTKKTQSQPVKYITLDHGPISWKCQVQFIDMEGLSDGRSLHMILPQVNPRKVLFVAGTLKETTSMRDSCLALSAFTRDVQMPQEGLTLNVSSSTNIYRLRLGDQLISSLNFQILGDYELARVRGFVQEAPQTEGKESEETLDQDLQMTRSDNPDLGKLIPILQSLKDTPLSRPHSSHLPGQSLKERTTLVGEVRLPELRRLIQASGLQADFRGEGVLVCTPGGVTIRKMATGRVAIHGPLSEVYFKVRKLLYSQFAIV